MSAPVSLPLPAPERLRAELLTAHERAAHARLLEALYASPDGGQDEWGSGVTRAVTRLLDADVGRLVVAPAAEDPRPPTAADACAAPSCAWMGALATVCVWWRAWAPNRRAGAGLLATVVPDRVHASLTCEWSARPAAATAERARALLDLVAPALVGALRVRALAGASGGDFPSIVGPRLAGRPDPGWRTAPLADRHAPATDDAALRERFGFTNRECEIARLLMRALSNAEIATRLGISPATARHHTEHVLTKLGVCSRAAVPAVLCDVVSAPVRPVRGAAVQR